MPWKASYMAGRVYGNTQVDLMGGTLQGDAFGGGAMAFVGFDPWTTKGNATLNIGKDNTQGEGPDYLGEVTILGNVYGANNFTGSPLGNVNVNVYKTAHRHVGDYDDYVPDILAMAAAQHITPAEALAINALTQDYAINAVFGGGNLAHYTPNQVDRTLSDAMTTVHVYSCDNTIRYTYGGGNAANVGTTTKHANSQVIIDGGRFHQVFGGGHGDLAQGAYANIYGTANTYIHAGMIDEVFGGGDQAGTILQTNLVFDHNSHNCCPEVIEDIFGAGNESGNIGDITTTISCSDA